MKIWVGASKVSYSAFFFYCLLPAPEKIFLSLRRKEEIKFSRSSICFLLLLIQPKKAASEICMFSRLLTDLLR